MYYAHAPWLSQRPRKIMCFGEVIWDLLPSGPTLGGAPANVAVHLAALGHQVSLVSRVGDDERGHQALAQLTARGVDTTHVQLDARKPTGIIQTHLVNGAPRYERVQGCAWENIAPSLQALRAAEQADALYFGTLAQHYPSGETLWQLLERVPERCVRVCDLNLRPPRLDPEVIRNSVLAANVIKLTQDEAELVSGILGASDLIEWLFAQTPAELVAVTRGQDGSILYTRSEIDEHPGFPAKNGGDSVGAGDAFTALVTHGWTRGAGLPSISRAANRYGSFVASARGASPRVPSEVLHEVIAEAENCGGNYIEQASPVLHCPHTRLPQRLLQS